MRLIFSRNRAAQLDLLLRSLERNAPPGDTHVLYRGDSGAFLDGYDILKRERLDVRFAAEHPDEFNLQLRAALVFSASETVTFFCDDNVLYRLVEDFGEDLLAENDQVLGFSLRLAYPHPAKEVRKPWLWRKFPPRAYPHPAKEVRKPWLWRKFPPHDHGYPGSIDGHTFRVEDVKTMMGDDIIENPLMLETILAHRCFALAKERPLFGSFWEQALVGVPVNTVADDQRRPHGDVHPQTAAELNRRFLAGERIDLDQLDFSGVDGCLHEIPFVWTQQMTELGRARARIAELSEKVQNGEMDLG